VFIKNFIQKEIAYFNGLEKNAQTLISSIFLYNLISPIFGIFINAFLWRQSHDLMLVAFYNAVMFAVIPFGFYLNGLMLRKFSPAIPYTLSLLANGGALAVLMFLPNTTYVTVFIFSIISGLSTGIYWANRNLLTLKTTQSTNRIYFSSIESSSGTFTKVIMPLSIGWFITFGTAIHFYPPIQGYQMLIFFILAIIIAIGSISSKIRIQKQPAHSLFVKEISEKWKKFRLLEFVLGLKQATVTFIPPLLVLILIGKEEALGAVQSMSAILAAIMIYTGVKSLHIKHRLSLISIGLGLTIFGALAFGFLYSTIGVLLFFACQALAEPFLWVAINSINYDLIDEDNKDPKKHYAYLCDQEIYLNGGRAIGILFFMLLLYLTSNEFSLRFAPLLFAVTQILLLFISRSIEKDRYATIPS
jgi:YQGE family putative transporter